MSRRRRHSWRQGVDAFAISFRQVNSTWLNEEKLIVMWVVSRRIAYGLGEEDFLLGTELEVLGRIVLVAVVEPGG